MLKERSQNPAVVVDVPEEPTAEELEVAEVEEEQEGEKTPQNEPKS